MKTALWDDLHVSRGKAEQLEAKLRRQAIEDEVRLAWVERTLRRAPLETTSCLAEAKGPPLSLPTLVCFSWDEFDVIFGVVEE